MNTIVIDVDSVPEHRACVLFYFHVILRKSTREDMKAVVFPFLCWRLPFCYFPLQFYFEATFSYLLFHPATRTTEVPSLRFNHATFLLYGMCYSESASTRFTHLAFIHPQVDIWILLRGKIAPVSLATSSLWNANLFHIVVHPRGNKTHSRSHHWPLSCAIFFNEILRGFVITNNFKTLNKISRVQFQPRTLPNFTKF